MFYNGETLICTKSFFIFEKGNKYYCSHVAEGHFYIDNNRSIFNVSSIKIPFGLANNFKIET